MNDLSFTNSRIILIAFILLVLAGCQSNVYDITEENYGKQLDHLAVDFNLPSEYLKALVILECSGKKEVPSRFEPGVYKQLKKLRAGKIKQYEILTQKDLQDASDVALKNLATSWGPFQLMGYKCLELGIKVEDIRGDSAMYWGIYWINKSYGDYLRQNRFEEAFRIHNTGSPTGRTHDPYYVKNGLRHIKYFRS